MFRAEMVKSIDCASLDGEQHLQIHGPSANLAASIVLQAEAIKDLVKIYLT
jgi:hypothetical protein